MKINYIKTTLTAVLIIAILAIIGQTQKVSYEIGIEAGKKEIRDSIKVVELKR